MRLKSLLQYWKRYRVESVLAPLFKMLEALFDLFVPLVVARLIDVGIGTGDRGYILRCETRLPGFEWVTRSEREALAMPSAFRYYLDILKEMGL